MYQQSMLSPLFERLSELRKDESGQIMPFTAVFSLFLVVIWLTVYNVGVGVTDKVRLQDMADQMAYSQAIVGARAMNLIALNNRTMVANLVSYTASVIMRSHSKFIRDLTLILYSILYALATVLGGVPIVGQILIALAILAGLVDLAAAIYDGATFFLALLWRFILNIQIVFILIPATKLLFTTFAAVPVLNIAEYQGSAIFRELTNEEVDASTSTPLWKQFGGRNLITSAFSSVASGGGGGAGAFTPAGAGLDIAALALQVVSWASWDNLVELPGDADDNIFDVLNLENTAAEVDASALSFKTTSTKISQQRRIQWMVSKTYPLSDRKEPLFGFSGSGGGGSGAENVETITQMRKDAKALNEAAAVLEGEAADLRAEAAALRAEDPPDTAGADAKDAQAAAKESEAAAKRSEAAQLTSDADALQAETTGDEGDFAGDVIGSFLGSDNQLWGFNRDPLGGLALGGGLVAGYAIFANAYCLAVHLSPAKVSMTFGGETRVGPYTPPFKPGRISQFGTVNNPRTDWIPYVMFSSGTFEKVPDFDEQFEIVGTDFFEVEVEYLDWDPWPSWEREDTISLEIGDAAFSSKLEPPVLQPLEDIVPVVLKTIYDSVWEDIPGFNGNSPNIWKGLFHEENPEYNDFYIGFDISSIIGFAEGVGITFSPQGYIEVDEKHYAEKYSTMFNLAYHYERQAGANIERRKGKYYVMVGKEYKSMRLLRWLGLLDSSDFTGGGLLEGVELAGHNGTGVILNGNTSDFEQDLGEDPDRNYGSYQAAANVEASREFSPHFFEHMVALSKSEVFYERPTKRTEFPNLFNAFWSARLAPLQTDVADFLGKLGLSSDMSKAFTFALTH